MFVFSLCCKTISIRQRLYSNVIRTPTHLVHPCRNGDISQQMDIEFVCSIIVYTTYQRIFVKY